MGVSSRVVGGSGRKQLTVIPAKAGIQEARVAPLALDPRFRGGDEDMDGALPGRQPRQGADVGEAVEA